MRSRLLAALLLCLTSAAQALPKATWLVAIGNNVGDTDEVGLLYAERDAQQLAGVLRGLGGVSGQRTVMLLGEDAESTRRALEEVNARIRASGERDTALVVYYSGHADAHALHQGQTTLPFDGLRDLVSGSSAKLRLLVVDACRSGGVSRVKGVAAATPFQIGAPESVPEGMAIITSSSAGESSQESDRLRGSFFSHHLMAGLRGAADANGDGRVSLSEAYQYAYDQTLRSSGRTLTLQHPTFSNAMKGKGALVLTRPEAPGRSLGRLKLGAPAVYLVSEVREGGAMVAELASQAPAATVALPARRYFVQQRLAREFREYRLTLPPGGQADLSQTAYRSLKYDRLVRMRGAEQTVAHAVMVLGGVQGEEVAGEGLGAQLHLGYRLDLPWFTPSLRLRLARGSDPGDDGQTERRHEVYALGLLLERFIDFRHASVSLGLLFEGGLHRQVFDTARTTEDRLGFAGAFGALLAVERSLGPIGLRLEGGPSATIVRQDEISDGVAVGQATQTLLAWRAAAGILWRF